MYRESFRLSKNTLKWVKKLHKKPSPLGEGGSQSETDEGLLYRL